MTGTLYQCENCGALFVYRYARGPAMTFQPVGNVSGALSRIENSLS